MSSAVSPNPPPLITPFCCRYFRFLFLFMRILNPCLMIPLAPQREGRQPPNSLSEPHTPLIYQSHLQQYYQKENTSRLSGMELWLRRHKLRACGLDKELLWIKPSPPRSRASLIYNKPGKPQPLISRRGGGHYSMEGGSIIIQAR